MRKNHYLYCILVFGFILGIHNGNIALWKEPDPQPIRVFPYAVSSLPPADQRALEQGICVQDQATLHRLLQDYLS